MTRIQDFGSFNAVREAGMAKLLPSRPRIGVGMGTCGTGNGAEGVYHAFAEAIGQQGRDVRLASVGCFGFCAQEPLVNVRIPGRPLVILRRVQASDVPRILDDLAAGSVTEGLALCKIEEWDHLTSHILYGQGYPNIPSWQTIPFFKPQKKIVLRNCGLISPDDIEEYIAIGGYQALYKVLIDANPEMVIEQIKAAKLRGRGGAGFLTGLKWEFLRKAVSDEKYVICNADEGDPGAYMNRNEIESDPHALLEGMIIGGYVMGAAEGIIYIRAEYPLAVHRLTRAIEQARQSGMLGDNILGRGFRFDIRLVEGAGAFVCGEETALIASLEGYAGRPRPRPPFPAQKGLYGKPTNINNVETWYNIAPIVSKGPAWFSEIGSTKSAGTKVFSLVGKINNTGLVEMPLGTPLKTFIYDVGEGGSDGKHVKAVQTGGPSGGCIPQEMFDTPVDYETLAQLGSIMGSGGMVVMDEDNCMVDVVALLHRIHPLRESCGKCIPCRVGLDKSLRILNAFTRGRGHRDRSGPARRDGPHDPRHLALRPGPDRAQSAAHHHAALPPRVRGPHPRQTLPRGRVRRPGALALREQLPAAHEHPALPAALQGGPPRGRVRSGGDGQSAAGLHRPRLPAPLRQPLPAAHAGFGGEHARGAPLHRRFHLPVRPLRRAGRAHCGAQAAAHGPQGGGRRRRSHRPRPRRSTWRCWATRSRSTNRNPEPGGMLRYALPEYRLPKRGDPPRGGVDPAPRREVPVRRRRGHRHHAERSGQSVQRRLPGHRHLEGGVGLSARHRVEGRASRRCSSWKRWPRRSRCAWAARWPSSAAATRPSIPRAPRSAWARRSPSSTAASARTCPPSARRRTPRRRKARSSCSWPRRTASWATTKATSRPSKWSRRGWASSIPPAGAGRCPPDEIRRLECDTVILAVGEAVDLDFARASGLRIKEDGTLEVDRYTLETSRSKFYAGGDVITGASNVSQRHGLRQEGGAQDRPAADGRVSLGQDRPRLRRTATRLPASPASSATRHQCRRELPAVR